MTSCRMSWLVSVIFLSFIFYNLSEAKHEKKLPSTVVVGSVYCDTCSQEGFSKTSHFISGASVAVECGSRGFRPSFGQEVKTNEKGEFRVNLPFSVPKHVEKIKGCSVKLISSSEPNCAVASIAASSSSLHLIKSRNQENHIFSAGFFSFKPLKQPALCTKKTSESNSNFKKSLIPIPKLSKGMVSQQEQLLPIPPLPFVPSPPPAFGIPLPPNPFRPPSILPPNPFQPPPSILPPNPFQPPPSILPPNPLLPPPSIFPPNPLQPAPPLFNLPPLPGLTPPSPPPPAFPIPLPPFPFQPSPVFPGIPPASSSSSEKTTP